MSGLVKAKKYDWKDSNMALFGSDTEKQVKKESAESEKAWQGVGQAPGLKIWRIVNFEVTEWPEQDYGKFFNGDSYIVLKTTKDADSDELKFDAHFWIGKNSTQDEYGTAAYKTVELDTFLDDRAVQHREVQGHESELFKSYFKALITMEGGAETGFRHVEPETYKPRLLHISRKSRTNITVREIPLAKSLISSDDVYILDLGLELIQFNGSSSDGHERFKAAELLQKLESERGGAKAETVDEGAGGSAKFFDSLTEEATDDALTDDDDDGDGNKKLLRFNSDSGGFDPVKDDGISEGDFVSDDVFLLDTPRNVIVWIGSNASVEEKKNGLTRAHNYLSSVGRITAPVTVVKEGQRGDVLATALAA